MSDQVIGGPLALDLFSLAGFNWVVQQSKDSNQNQRAAAQGANGDEIASKLYDAKQVVSCTYKCKETGGNLSIPSVNKVYGGILVESVRITTTPNDWPTMEVSGHQHTENPHDSGLNEYAPTLTIPAGFGVPVMFGQANAACGRKGFTYSLTCEHTDEGVGDGTHLAGEAVNGKEEVSFEFVGTPTLEVPAGWDQTNEDDTRSNTAKDATSYQFVHPVTRS